MRIIELTDISGERLLVGVPDDRPFIIREVPSNHRGPGHTMITFGSVWARVKEGALEVAHIIIDEDGQ